MIGVSIGSSPTFYSIKQRALVLEKIPETLATESYQPHPSWPLSSLTRARPDMGAEARCPVPALLRPSPAVAARLLAKSEAITSRLSQGRTRGYKPVCIMYAVGTVPIRKSIGQRRIGDRSHVSSLALLLANRPGQGSGQAITPCYLGRKAAWQCLKVSRAHDPLDQK